MRKVLCLVVMICYSFPVCGQQEEKKEDLKYLEDQFYMGFTYNFLLDKPAAIRQQNLSYGLQLGFIRDLPINQRRTLALGIGVGYGVNSYDSNLLVTKQDNSLEYSILPEDLDVKRNKLETHLLEVPLEFRWRNSSPTEYKFWRFYAGMKLGYVFSGRSKQVSNSDKESFTNTDIERFQYGLMANIGYNTFNIHIYYALNNLFKDGRTLNTGEDLTFTPLRVGLIFYIL